MINWVILVRALLYSKKGDLEFIEAIMVLVVIVVLIVIGLVVYNNVTSAGLKQTGKRITDTQATVLINVVDSLPEVQCSIRGATKDCVDLVKIQAFKKIVGSSKNTTYIDMFGWKTIRFEQVYPVLDKSKLTVPNGECTSNAFMSPDYPLSCGNWTVYYNPKPNFLSRDIVKTTVSLFDPFKKTYAVGALYVEVYS
jgi:hypothetical protein